MASFLVLLLSSTLIRQILMSGPPTLCTLSIKVAPAYSTYIDLAAQDYVATTQVSCFSASILRESDWCVLLAGSTYSILFLRSNANSPKWIYTVGLWVVAKPPHSLLVLLLYTYLAYIALYIIPYVLLGSMYPLDDHKSCIFVQKKTCKARKYVLNFEFNL